MLITLSFLLLTLPDGISVRQEGQATTDEISVKFLGRIDKAEKGGDWESIFVLYEEALRRHRFRVAPDPEHPGVQVGMVEYLIRRYSRLPAAAFEYYRLTRDARARQMFEEASIELDPLELDRMLSLYFFSSMSDEYHDRLARYLQEHGLFDDALLYWDRLLRYYPDPDIPAEVLVARMAIACRLGGNVTRLSDLKRLQVERKIDGIIWAGREKKRLSDFLTSVEIPPIRKIESRASPLPTVSRQTGGGVPRYVRNDVLWWTYEFSSDKKLKSTPRSRPNVIGEPTYPLFPAYCRLKGNPYVIFTNGYRVIAVNPDRVREGSRIKGVYWKYPVKGPLKISQPVNRYGVQYNRPYIGVTVEGEHAFVTLYSSKRDVPNNRDSFSGPTRLICFHIPTGRVVWSTDEMYAAVQGMERREQQTYDFLDRNFAFSGPPLVRGGKVFAGICSSPAGEQEARVLCLDSSTGRPLWCSFIASLGASGGRFRSRGMSLSPFLPMMVEEGGSLFVQTSLGVVAALRSTTGSVLWLSRYRRDLKPPNWNVRNPATIRPANSPILYQGKIWLLPQDANGLLAFDRETGKNASLPRAVTKIGDLPWSEIKWLLGIVDNWMILGGVSSYVLRLRDLRAHSLAAADTSGCGRGQIVGGDIYFSIRAEGSGSLGLYAGSGSWRKLRTSEWRGKNQKGNLLVAGSTLVVSTDRIQFYSDLGSIRRRFAPRLKQSPPRIETLLSYGDLMERNGVLGDATQAYLEYIRLMEGKGGDPGKLREVRNRLYEIFLRNGEALKSSSALEVLEYFRKAKSFAPDREKLARMTWKIGTHLAKLNQNREAILIFQEMLESHPDYIFSIGESGKAIRLREFSRRKIAEIRGKEPQSYRQIEARAQAALQEVSGEDPDGWSRVRRLYPDSQAAAEATRLLLAARTKGEKWKEVLVLLREITSPEDPRPILEILEKIGDRDRLVAELKSWGRNFGDQVVVIDGQSRNVHEIVRAWLQRIAEKPVLSEELPEGHQQRVGSTIRKSPGESLHALEPKGILPPMFPRDMVLLQRGSSVELRHIRDGSRKWIVPHPFGYSGIRIRAEGTKSKVQWVAPNSPGSRSGIRLGDEIVSVNGSYGSFDLISLLLTSGRPDKVLSIRVRREKEEQDLSCKLEKMPPDKGSVIMGASFTQGYSLAIVWKNAVVAVDVLTGKTRWSFSPGSGSFTIRGMETGDGRLLLYGSDHPKWRLICLEDATGGIRWIREFKPINGAAQREWIYLPYRDGPVSLFQMSNAGPANLQVFDPDSGDSLCKAVLFSRGVLSHVVDGEEGLLHLVHGISSRNRRLQTVSLRSEDAGKERLSIPLQTNEVGTDLRGCRLFVQDPFLVLMLPAGTNNRSGGIHIFNMRRRVLVHSIKLSDGRTWSKASCENSPIDSDGTLYLYSDTVSVEPGNRVGFLGAYTLGDTPLLKWEAVVPAIPSLTAARWRVETRLRNHLLFVSPQASIPGERGSVPVAALYSKKREGYLEQVFRGLDGNLRGGLAVSLGRGHILISTHKGVEIYGSR